MLTWRNLKRFGTAVQSVTTIAESLGGSPADLKPVAETELFYFPQLDGMRTLAFLMVFGSHAGGFTVANFPPVVKQLASVYNAVVQVGWSGVDLFFVLSAFLITSLLLREEQTYNKVSVSKFLLRRVLRIWPVYFLVVVIGLCVFPFITEPVPIKFGSHTFVRYVWLNLAWFMTFTMNLGMAWFLACPPANLTPLWSISLEEQFYLFWGFFIKGIKGATTRMTLLTVMIAGTIGFRAYLMQHAGSSHVPYYVNTFSRLDPLIFGTLIAFGVRYVPTFLPRVGKISLLCLSISVAIFLWANSNGSLFIEQHAPFALTLFDFGWMLFVLSVLTFKPLVALFSNKYLASFGRLTYGMYVIHAMVIQTIETRVLTPLGIPQHSNESSCFTLFVGLPLTFVLAWSMWHLYEKHFYKLKYKFSPVKSGYLAQSQVH